MLADICRVLQSDKRAVKWYRRLYSQLSQLFELETFFVARWQKREEQLEFICMIHHDKHYGIKPIQLQDTLLLRAIQSGEVVWSGNAADIDQTTSVPLLNAAIGIDDGASDSFIYAPVIAGKKTVGVLGVIAGSTEVFHARHRYFFRIVADQLVQRMKADKTHERLEEQYQSVLNALSIGLVVVNEDRSVLFMNEKFQEYIAGANSWQTCDDVCAHLHIACDRCIGQSDVMDTTMRPIKLPNGEKAMFCRYPFFVEQTYLGHILAIFPEEIDQGRAAEIIQLEKFKAVLSLVGAMAHKLNQPLTGITCYSSMLLEDIGPDGEYYQEILEIDTQAQRLEALIRRFQQITRLENLPYISETEILDLDLSVGDKKDNGE